MEFRVLGWHGMGRSLELFCNENEKDRGHLK